MSETTIIGRGPVHGALEAHGAVWRTLGDTAIAWHFGDEQTEIQAARDLALCDLSALPKFGVKGPGCAAWLTAQGLPALSAIYDTARLPDNAILVRTGTHEYLLEDGPQARTMARLTAAMQTPPPGVYHLEQQQATFMLSGARSELVLAQTCGINFAEAPDDRVIYTRAAGVSCAILPNRTHTPRYRIWVDYSFAPALWESLHQITEELHGRLIGAAGFLPS